MQPILLILLLFSGTVLSRYHEKRRFDRSIDSNYKTPALKEDFRETQATFIDNETHFAAYKNAEENDCYLERLVEHETEGQDVSKNPSQQKTWLSKVLYASTESLTKLEAWRIAGGRIVEFCHGTNIILLQDTEPTPKDAIDPFMNEVPEDENDVVTRRVADVVLTPLISRAKRQIMLEEREKLDKEASQVRSRRQAPQFHGRFRGQTQSQYLTIGNEDQKEGKAEAEATQQSSHAVVSGSRGMGQAQSMSMGGTGCEDCPGYPGYRAETAPNRLQVETLRREDDRFGKVPGLGVATPSGMLPGTRITYPGISVPGTGIGIPSGGMPSRTIMPGITTYPAGPPTDGKSPTGAILPAGTRPLPSGETYSDGIMSGITPSEDRGTYPVGASRISSPIGGTAQPGRTIGTYPGVISPIIEGGAYPDQIGPGPTTGSIATYPGTGVQGTGLSSDIAYPGGVISKEGVTYAGGITQGRGKGTIIPDGAVPGSISIGGRATYPTADVPGSAIGGNVPYPGGAVPGTITRGTEDTYRGGVPSQGDRIYPGVIREGGVIPGTTLPGGTKVYPGEGDRTGSRIIYPGVSPSGISPPARTAITGTEGRASYPVGGIKTPIQSGTETGYPGSGIPSTSSRTTAGSEVVYSGGLAPGGASTGSGMVYPVAIVPGAIATESGTSYPGNIPSTVGGTVTYPGGGGIPGTVPTEGRRVYPGTAVPGTITEGRVTYPGGGVPGTVTEGKLTYPGGAVPGTITEGRVTYPGGGVPGTVTGGKLTYPGDTAPGTVTYPGGTVSSGALTEGRVLYPGGAMPSSRITEDKTTYPGDIIPGTVPTGGVAPGTVSTGGIAPGTVTTGGVAPGTVTIGAAVPRTVTTGGAVPYPSIATYPGTIPGTVNTGTGSISGAGAVLSYPGSVQPSTGQILYPSGTIPSGPVSVQGGQVGIGQPSGTYPSGAPTSISTTPVIYPGASTGQLAHSSEGTYPTQGQLYQVQTDRAGKYPSGMDVIPGQVPEYLRQPAQYPGGTWQDGTKPGITGGIQYPSGVTGDRASTLGIGQQGIGQYPDGGVGVGGQIGGIGQYQGSRYQGARETAVGTGGVSQYYTQPVGPVRDDGADSQASSSIKQVDSGTQASALAQGNYGEGTAQSQVTGTYSGSGSFSAQAGSVDTNKSAQTEISGGKEGATSNAQGVGGYGKSQAQVQLDSESGATSTGAQSSGWNHGTNSQVQASSRGGIADAQANGEGSTSSQAQIGFQPYLNTNEKVERQSRPFRGGGTASAQSGTHRGQSQSQLQGSFQYGISYTGAAQAGSGSGAVASRKPFNFNVTNTELFKSFTPYKFPTISSDGGSEIVNTAKNFEHNQARDVSHQGLQTSSSSRKIIITNPSINSSEVDKRIQSTEKPHPDDTMYDGNADYDEEYEDEDYDSSSLQTSTTPKISTSHDKEESNNRDHQQSQMIHVSTGSRQYDVRVSQDSNTPRVGDTLQPGQSLPGYKIPPGFRAKITSVSGEKTIAQGDGESQSQTIAVIPTGSSTMREYKSPIAETRSLQTNHERLIEQHSLTKNKSQSSNSSGSSPVTDYSKHTSVTIKPSYYTVTNSVAGKLDSNKNAARKYEHRYYTKSSTCGYFTFSCNVVYGSNGRRKICKPKMPTYSNGTPIKC